MPNSIHIKSLAYNLIVCRINLKQYTEARKDFLKFSEVLSKEDLDSLGKNISAIRKQKPNKEAKEAAEIEKDGAIKSFCWFSSNLNFADVIGLEKTKKEIKTKILGPMLKPAIYENYGARITGGAILFGPPGTGKTLLAKAIAGEAKGKMLIVKASDIKAKYQGDSEKNIKVLFSQARTNSPSLIFFDEMDGITQSRDDETIGGNAKSIQRAWKSKCRFY